MSSLCITSDFATYPNNFSISFYPPIKPFEKDIPDTKAMLSIHKIIEKWILENPSQWFWQHNRFN